MSSNRKTNQTATSANLNIRRARPTATDTPGSYNSCYYLFWAATIPPIATRITVAWSVHASSVTLVHLLKPLNRMRCHLAGTLAVSSNTVLHGPQSPTYERETWGSEPPVHSDAAYRQMTLALVKKNKF